MKKITHEQSRRNSARRRREVEARHRQAGRWGQRPEPVLTSGKISYEIGGNVEATPFGGIFAMHRLVTRLGLVKAIDGRPHLLKLHLPYHESDHVGVACRFDRWRTAGSASCAIRPAGRGARGTAGHIDPEATEGD